MSSAEAKKDAIANADAATNNAVPPTYTELLAALRQSVDAHAALLADRLPRGKQALAEKHSGISEARALIARADKTLAGNFGA